MNTLFFPLLLLFPTSLQRGDFLSTMLSQRQFDWWTIVTGIGVAILLGGAHALSPGHGKTIVAAYLVGSRGTLRHALLLGATVTFTHTISVFLLGVGVLFFQQHVMPERIIPVLGACSGISIVCVGIWLLYQRSSALLNSAHGHDHDHGDGDGHTHTHDGSTHTHAMPDGPVSPAGLIALGISGGLVPCPSALILLLSCVALGRTALGLMLLTGFSAGLAGVLILLGVMVIHARNLLPSRAVDSQHPLFGMIPVFSSVVVIVLGLLMTLVATGAIRPIAFLS